MRRWLRWGLAFVAGMLLAIGVGYALRPNAGGEAPPAAPAPPTEPTLAPPAPPSPPAASSPGSSRPIEPGGTLQLERAAFPASGPVRVSLELPEMSASSEPRPVRLVSQPDHRVLEVSGTLESGRTAAAIEVDPGYLEPGTYLVELQTTERSHFPLRRYFIVVR